MHAVTRVTKSTTPFVEVGDKSSLKVSALKGGKAYDSTYKTT
jgi:hypothetical protein